MPRSKIIFLIVLGVISSTIADTCNHDNCYRGFNGAAYKNDAQSFCSSFTQSVVTATAGLPTRASACSGVARVSSVCSCAYPTLLQTSSVKKLASVTSSSIISVMTSTPPSKSPTTFLTTTSAPVFAPYIPKWASIPGCNGDNCMNAFDGHNGGAFCSLFTLGGNLAPPFPSYATMCGPATSSRVSSACFCLNYVSNAPLGSRTSSPAFISSLAQPIISISSASGIPIISAPTSSSIAAPTPLPSTNSLAVIDATSSMIVSVDPPIIVSLAPALLLSSPTLLPIITAPSSGPAAVSPSLVTSLAGVLSDPIPVLTPNLDPTIPVNSSPPATSQLPPFTSIKFPPEPILASTAFVFAPAPAITSIRSPNSAPLICNEDSCLRAMELEGGGTATAFCASFTAAVVTDIAALPTYASMCFTDAISQVSSACSCLTPSHSAQLPATTAADVIHVPMEPIPVAPARTMSAAIRHVAGDLVCNADSCLRAMEREGGAVVTGFCASFTSATVTESAALPTFATECSTNAVSQISSACSCLGASVFDTPTTATIGN